MVPGMDITKLQYTEVVFWYWH